MHRSWIVAAAVMVATAVPSAPARANGGAYITFEETYYVPGAPVEGEAYVFVPDAKLGLLERGPFTLYAVPRGTELRQGAPVPANATALGTLTVHEPRDGDVELTASFTLPALAPGEKTVGMCSPGCELTGFGEPLTGSFIVATSAREVDLLRRNDELEIAVANMKRSLKESERQIDELDATLAAARDARDAAVEDGREAVGAAEARANAASAALDRTADALLRWRAFALAAAAAAVVSFALWSTSVRRRRAEAPSVPDTPEELLEPAARR